MAKNRAKSVASKTDNEKMDQIINLLQTMVALEMYRLGAKQQNIGKQLGVATSKVNDLLKNVKKEG